VRVLHDADLQARGRATAAGLADELEVSVATARRDLEALSAAVNPVHPQPGRGGWSLPGGARTDLTALTAPAAQALFGESAEARHSYYDGHAEQTAFVLARVPPDEDERVAPDRAGMMRLGLPGPLSSLSAEDAAGPPFDVDLATELAAADGEPVVVLDVLTTAIVTGHRNRRLPRRRRVRLGRCRGPRRSHPGTALV
jgi:hypothetical protein